MSFSDLRFLVADVAAPAAFYRADPAGRVIELWSPLTTKP